MRINKFVALATGLSRRTADAAIAEGRVQVDGKQPSASEDINSENRVTLDNKPLTSPEVVQTIMLNKPVGYVCSRDGQGSKTIYDLLPPELHRLKPVGRLDKDSSGLLLLTNDGDLAHQLTHPSFQKEKVYEVTLDKPLTTQDIQHLQKGIKLEDGLSKLQVHALPESKIQNPKTAYEVRLHEGRNRQIRRTFAASGYRVIALQRICFGPYQLDNLTTGNFVNLV